MYDLDNIAEGEFKDRDRTQVNELIPWELLTSNQYRNKNEDPILIWKSVMKTIILNTLKNNLQTYKIYIKTFVDYIDNISQDTWNIILTKNHYFIILSYLFKNLINKQDRNEVVTTFFEYINSNNKIISLEKFNMIDLYRYVNLWDRID